MTKKQMGIFNNYNYSYAGSTIYQAYKKPSWNKVKAFNACEEDKHVLNGYDSKILSATCQFFTYAFKYMDHDGEHLRYYTGRSIYDFLLSKIDQATGELIDLF